MRSDRLDLPTDTERSRKPRRIPEHRDSLPHSADAERSGKVHKVQSHSRAQRCFPSAHLGTVCWSTLVQHIQMHVPCLSLAIPRPARDQQLGNSLLLDSSFPLHALLHHVLHQLHSRGGREPFPGWNRHWKVCSCPPTVKPQIIDAFRVQEVTSVNLMVALDQTEEAFMKTCKQALGIDTETGDFAHKREWAKLQMVWEASEDRMRHQRSCPTP